MSSSKTLIDYVIAGDVVGVTGRINAGDPVDGVPGQNPLQTAAMFGHLPVIKALVELGADVNTEENGSRPYDWVTRGVIKATMKQDYLGVENLKKCQEYLHTVPGRSSSEYERGLIYEKVTTQTLTANPEVHAVLPPSKKAGNPTAVEQMCSGIFLDSTSENVQHKKGYIGELSKLYNEPLLRPIIDAAAIATKRGTPIIISGVPNKDSESKDDTIQTARLTNSYLHMNMRRGVEGYYSQESDAVFAADASIPAVLHEVTHALCEKMNKGSAAEPPKHESLRQIVALRNAALLDQSGESKEPKGEAPHAKLQSIIDGAFKYKSEDLIIRELPSRVVECLATDPESAREFFATPAMKPLMDYYTETFVPAVETYMGPERSVLAPMPEKVQTSASQQEPRTKTDSRIFGCVSTDTVIPQLTSSDGAPRLSKESLSVMGASNLTPAVQDVASVGICSTPVISTSDKERSSCLPTSTNVLTLE